MAHSAVHEEPVLRMGVPVPHGKLAVWIFLATEIMFFTALIGTYTILRNGMPTKDEPWPQPHDVHLVEWLGALNTFVLICSSVSVVLAHWALTRHNTKQAVSYIALTLILGTVFLVVKGFEYQAKWEHKILPGYLFDRVDGARGVQYLNLVKDQLKHAEEHAHAEVRPAIKSLMAKLELKDNQAQITPAEVSRQVKELLEKDETLHLTPIVPWGNMWASCYFAMTGFHALHVLGGLVIFVIILLMAAVGKFGPQHESFVELTGLYWHFVDIVWIFLFPLLYLV